MNYTDPNNHETGNALDVKEPVAAYYTGKVGNAVAEPYEADWDDDGEDFGAPESVTVRSYEELCRKLEEGMADVRAGRVYPWEDVRRELRRKYFNESI